MALRAALKDRGRIVRLEADATRVEGRTKFHQRIGPNFRARLDLQESPKAPDAAGEMKVTETPVLIADRVDAERNFLVFQPDEKVEVESRDFNEDGSKAWNVVAIFQVDGEPKPLRKKRKVIGWELRLKRVTESPATAGRTS